MSKMTVHLTERFVRTTEPARDRNIIVYDDEVGLFGLRITEAGSKSFILTYRVAGRERRITIRHHATSRSFVRIAISNSGSRVSNR